MGGRYSCSHRKDFRRSKPIRPSGRVSGSHIETYRHKDCLLYTSSVAPYHVIITLVKPGDKEQEDVAERIYRELINSGAEVLLDDRDERPGVKFKDADLLGIPLRITVGKRACEGIVEYKLRRESEKEEKTVEEAIKDAAALVNAEK